MSLNIKLGCLYTANLRERVCVPLICLFIIPTNFLLKMANDTLLDLLSATDNLVENYLRPKEWLGTLPLLCCMICPRNEPLLNVPLAPIDLIDFCKGGKKAILFDKNYVVRFDPSAYPLPENGGNFFGIGSSGHKLVTDLLAICHRDGGSTFCSNGCAGSNNKNSRRITCHHFYCYKSFTKEKKIFGDLALRKNASKTTLPKSNRTLTGKATIKDERCGAFFVVNVDSKSYFMTIGSGNGKHKHHAPHNAANVLTPKRIIPADLTIDIQQLGYFNAPLQTIVTMANERHDCPLSCRQVGEMVKFSRMATSMHETGIIPDGKMSNPDAMVAYFTNKNIPHILLSHHKDIEHFEFKGQTLNGRKNKTKRLNDSINDSNTENDSNKENVVNGNNNSDGTKNGDEGSDLDSDGNKKDSANGYIAMEHGGGCDTAVLIGGDDDVEMQKMVEYGNDSRISLQAENNQSVMISFLWCTQYHRRLFQAFPEVLYVDGTHGTNNDRMPLLTVGIRDRKFNMHVVIRAFIPNERAWLFRWIFHCGIPALMGSTACQKVKLVVTDGDSQETTQLDEAIRAGIYGEAKRRRCGWHIIGKGSQVRLRWPNCDKKNTNVKKIVSIMKWWVYESLMKDVETVYEYKR